MSGFLLRLRWRLFGPGRTICPYCGERMRTRRCPIQFGAYLWVCQCSVCGGASYGSGGTWWGFE